MLRAARTYPSRRSQRIVDPCHEEKYIEGNREYLFFSDPGGFRWFVDVNAQRAARGAAPVDRAPR